MSENHSPICGRLAVLGWRECVDAGLRAPLGHLAQRLEMAQRRLSAPSAADAAVLALEDIEAAQRQLRGVLSRFDHLVGLVEGGAVEAPRQIEEVALGPLFADLRILLQTAECIGPLRFDEQPVQTLSMRTDGVKLRHLLVLLLGLGCRRVCPDGAAEGEAGLLAELTARGEGGWLTLALEDPGLSPAATDPADLAAIRRLAELLGGEAEVLSLAAGMRLSVRLPLSLPLSPPEPAMPRRGATVLVIDDDTVLHELLAEALNRESWRLLHACDEQQGFELAVELQPDIIVLNVLGSGLDGWGLLARLKSSTVLRSVPVVVLTLAEEEAESGYLLRASDFITKPFRFDALLATANRYRPATGEAVALVVEDDGVTRTILCRLLQRDGWRVVGAANGYDGLKQIDQIRPAMVLLDLMMPGMDGFEFLKVMRMTERGGQHLPVIVVTAKDLSQNERDWLAGTTRTITERESVSRGELIGAIREWVSHATERGTIVV